MKATILLLSAALQWENQVSLAAPLGDGDPNVDKTATCSFYVAKSTIPRAGLGIFAGVPFEKDDNVGFSDLSIPIVDIDFHAGGSHEAEDYHWLASDYTWGARVTGDEMALEADEVTAFITGLGALPNCHFNLQNAVESINDYGTAGISRADAGAGAFTPYHNRATHTTAAVLAGQELFVSYGTQWFLTRQSYMGLIPLSESYPIANKFMESAEKLLKSISTVLQEDSGEEVPRSSEEEAVSDAMSDLWDMILQSPYKSHPYSAIPKSLARAKRAFVVGIQQSELEQSIHSLDYLDGNGKCLDFIRPGNSSIPNAGRGAFATRFIPKDGYVHIAPLMHMPERDILTMYAADLEEEEEVRDIEEPTGHQLILNYCFGHTSSTMLLCPYSSGSSYINHNSESPNAKIVWSTDQTYNNASWFDEPVSYFDNIWHTGLSFEYVATQDINEGDEVVIDYGAEWEDAWEKHIQQWQPPEGAETYMSPQQFNEDPSLPIPTYDEEDYPLNKGIEIWCHFSPISIYKGRNVWQEEYDMVGTDYLVLEILNRAQHEKSYTYTLMLEASTSGGEQHEHYVREVPREALKFFHSKYKSDVFIEGAFRHEMMIPDEMFPDAWRNIIND